MKNNRKRRTEAYLMAEIVAYFPFLPVIGFELMWKSGDANSEGVTDTKIGISVLSSNSNWVCANTLECLFLLSARV